MSVEKMETSCMIKEKKVIHPFAYRTHTHSLGEWHLVLLLSHHRAVPAIQVTNVPSNINVKRLQLLLLLLHLL